MGHHGAGHPNDTQEVRIEDRSGLPIELFRPGGGDTEAGVVHEQIDVALQTHHVPDAAELR